jgi:1-acyl-sn-glycerol-3-phosphate acyltransferase
MQKKQEHKYMKGVHGFLRIFLFIYTRFFSIKSSVSSDVKDLKAPYLLLSNHIGTWDPFVIGYFLDAPIHFVSSDAVFRDRFMRFILTRMGVIPKKKNVKDTRVIRIMINVIKNNNCIGLFPEASRSWTGRTMYIDSSTAKLIKLLNVPVVTAKMKGMQLFNPRWGTWLRKTKVMIDYNLCLKQDDIRHLSEEEILSTIRTDLYHDEVEYQRENMNVVHSFRKAEYISYVLFLCPSCQSIGKIHTKGNNFSCSSCNSHWHIDKFSFFKNSEKEKSFDNIIDWYDWQLDAFNSFIQSKIREGAEEGTGDMSKPLFSDQNMIVLKEKNNGFRRVGVSTMNFYIDRIELVFSQKKKMILFIKDIETLSPQLRERIEIFYEGKAYRIRGRKRGISGLKWEIACNNVWKSLGQDYKLSTYFLQD